MVRYIDCCMILKACGSQRSLLSWCLLFTPMFALLLKALKFSNARTINPLVSVLRFILIYILFSIILSLINALITFHIIASVFTFRLSVTFISVLTKFVPFDINKPLAFVFEIFNRPDPTVLHTGRKQNF
jgi:hypothetical protein